MKFIEGKLRSKNMELDIIRLNEMLCSIYRIDFFDRFFEKCIYNKSLMLNILTNLVQILAVERTPLNHTTFIRKYVNQITIFCN